MTSGLVLLVALLAPDSVVNEEAKRAGEPVVRQLFSEADGAWYKDQNGEARLTLWGRARASADGGVCAREALSIRMARPGEPPAAPPGQPARIRDVESKREFHVIRDDRNEPRWDLTGDALERACADPGEARFDWMTAASSSEARAAVQSLLLVERELAKPQSPLVRLKCSSPGCSDRGQLARLLQPLGYHEIRTCDAGDKRRCQEIFLSDYRNCGGWRLQIVSEWEEPLRIRHARFLERPHIAIHCLGEES
jgi:hypothetical protein